MFKLWQPFICLSCYLYTAHTYPNIKYFQNTKSPINYSDEHWCALVRVVIMAFLYPQVLERQRKANLPTAMRIGFVIINQPNNEVENPENAQIIMEKYFDTLEENNSPRNILYSHLLEIYKYFCESLLEAGSVESGSFDHLMRTFGRSVIDSGLFTCLSKLIHKNKLTITSDTQQRNICLVAIDIIRLFTNRMHSLSHAAHKQLVAEEEGLLIDLVEMLLDEKISEFYRCLIFSVLVDLCYSKCGLDWIVKQEKLFKAMPNWFLEYNDVLEPGLALKPPDNLSSQNKAMLMKPMYKKLIRSLKSGSLHILATIFYPSKVDIENAERVGHLLIHNAFFKNLSTKFYHLSLPFLPPLQHKDFLLFNSAISLMINGTVDICMEELCNELFLFNRSRSNPNALLSLRYCGVDNSQVSPIAYLLMFALSLQQRVFQLENMLQLFGTLLTSASWTRELLYECAGTELVDLSFYGTIHQHSVYGDIRLRSLRSEDYKLQRLMITYLIKPLVDSQHEDSTSAYSEATLEAALLCFKYHKESNTTYQERLQLLSRGKKLLVRAVKSLDSKDKSKAIRICTKGLAVTPLEAIKLQSALYYLRAQCYYVVGIFSKAAHDCTRSMIISPHYFTDVQWLRALCYYNMGIYYASWVDLRCVRDSFDKQSKIKKKQHKFYLTEVEKHLGFSTNK